MEGQKNYIQVQVPFQYMFRFLAFHSHKRMYIQYVYAIIHCIQNFYMCLTAFHTLIGIKLHSELCICVVSISFTILNVSIEPSPKAQFNPYVKVSKNCCMIHKVSRGTALFRQKSFIRCASKATAVDI